MHPLCVLAPTLCLLTCHPQPQSQLLPTRRPQPQPCAPLVHHTPTCPTIGSFKLDRLQRVATAAALPPPLVSALHAPPLQPNPTPPVLRLPCLSLTMAAQPPRSITLHFPLFSAPFRHSSCGYIHPACRHIPFACLQLHHRLSGYLPISFHPRPSPVHFFFRCPLSVPGHCFLFPRSPFQPPLFPLPGEQHCRPPICQADPGFTRCCLV